MPLLLAALVALGSRPADAAPEGQLTWGVHITLAPTWFDPAEASEMITPFMVYYALHDAMVKPMPGNAVAPALAESWTVAPNGLAWHDRRVRQAASLAMNRPAINQAETLGFSKITGNIIPSSFEFFWPSPAPVYDPARAKRLLAEAGHASGFDAGDYYCDASYSNLAEAVLNDLQAVGIRAKLRPLERAAFFSGIGPRVGESGLGLIGGHAYSAPYEDVTLKAR